MLEIDPVLTIEEATLTAEAIASVQLPDGAIPEFPGGVINPWNHVEAAMALDVAGFHERARRAYRWSAAVQRDDGDWPAGFLDHAVVDETRDANFSAYLAFGLRHHYVCTGDRTLLEEMWPVVDRAMTFVLDLQRPDGTISWARDAHGRRWDAALLTSSSCIHMSLRSAVAIAGTLGHERPEWELALSLLGDAISGGDHNFQPKRRFSMDWYYPVIARVIEGEAARERLRSRWDDFVVSSRGCRCVSDRPWITSGETAELVLALIAAELPMEASLMLRWVQHLRDEDGAYWIGATFPDGTVWPRQKPTWGSGSVVLAADVLRGGPSALCF